MTQQTVSPQTFVNMSSPEGLDFLSRTSSIPIKDFQINISPELIQKFLDFIKSERFDLDVLVNSHHSFLWEKDNSMNDELKKQTIQKILNPESYSHINSFKSLSNYFYQVSNHVMGDTCSGFTILKNPESRVKISGIDFLHKNKESFLQKRIQSLLAEKNSLVYLTEYDFLKMDLSEHSSEMLILNPEIHEGNNGKALCYRQGLLVSEFTEDDIRKLLQEHYSEEILESYEKFKQRFSLVDMDDITLLLIHSKSVGSKKDIQKNREIYDFLCQVKNMFLDSPCIMMGDFNIPLPSEENGHLGYTSQTLENYPLRDEESWLQWVWRQTKSMFFNDTEDYINKGFTRAIYDPEQVIGKARSDNGFFNSQVFRGKFYDDRNYNTDQIFVNFPSPNLKAEMFPKRSEVPLIPYIGKSLDASDSHLSDHQILQSRISYLDSSYSISTFNALSNCCSQGPPLKNGLTVTEIKALEMEYSMLMNDIYHNMSFS